MEWPTPKNVNEVRSFMGLASYYRRFIMNFSNIGYSITTSQIKGTKFDWKVECAASFEPLKKLLTTAPVLRIANPGRDFTG